MICFLDGPEQCDSSPKFKLVLNEVGTHHGITFRGGGKTVYFLDCTVELQTNGCMNTKMYTKLTERQDI